MTSAPIARTTPARLYGNAYLLLALAGLCWSGNHILGRAIAGQVPPFAVACVRYLLAALILYPFARAHLAKDWPAIRAQLPLMTFSRQSGEGCSPPRSIWHFNSPAR